MNLESTIRIFAGGPGSGCRGSNCGRPHTFAEVFQKHGIAGTASPETKVKKRGKFFTGFFDANDKQVRTTHRLPNKKDEFLRIYPDKSWEHIHRDDEAETTKQLKAGHGADELGTYLAKGTKGIRAGGPGSGCSGPNCGRPSLKSKFKEAGIEMPKINYTVRHKSQYEGDINLELNTSAGQFFQRGENVKDAKERFFDWYLSTKLQKKEIKSAVTKKKLKRPALRGTSGGQSEGSSLISRNYKVVDGLGRKLHEFKTKEEAEQASAGNRYTKVWRTTIPDEDTPEVRDMIRKRPGDTQVRTFRRSMPFPNTPFPQGPTGR
jgi:hypothetical protein